MDYAVHIWTKEPQIYEEAAERLKSIGEKSRMLVKIFEEESRCLGNELVIWENPRPGPLKLRHEDNNLGRSQGPGDHAVFRRSDFLV